MNDPLMDKHGAAKYLGISVHTLATHRARGKFPVADQRFGRSDAWLQSTLDVWRLAHPTNRKPEETHA